MFTCRTAVRAVNVDVIIRSRTAQTTLKLKSRGQRQTVRSLDLWILDEVHRGSNISQRVVADRLGMAVGAVNRHLHDMIEAGYLEVANRNVRPFAYKLTISGKQYRQMLSHEHYSWVLGNLRAVEERISSALRELKTRGVTRVVFYGAGEVMEVTYRLSKVLGLQVLGVVDDDFARHGLMKDGLLVEAPGTINQLAPDAVVITTFRHAREIRLKIDPSLRSSIRVWEL